MFYSETILSRRGALGKVWIAAHMERKLSKSQTLQTDIEQSVDAIMSEEIELMALRLSGQLLLGVVRIYGRKAKYLLDDCNEALLKIKMAFRPGVVDLTEDQLTVNKTAITLQPSGIGLDLLLPDVNWDMDFEERPVQRQGHHQAHIDDITLRTADDFHNFGEADPFDLGPADGIGSQDFNDLDLGINWDDEAQNENRNDKSDQMSAHESVGVGRDAFIDRESIDIDIFGRPDFAKDDLLSHISKSREPSQPAFDNGMDMDMDPFPGLDLGDLGIGFDDVPVPENEPTPGQTRESSRASSPLTEPPATPPPIQPSEDAMDVDVVAPPTEKPKKKIKDKKQIVDSIIELENATNNRGRLAGNANPLNTDTDSITTKQRFLPRSAIVMRLLDIRDDPLSYFLPTQVKGHAGFVSNAPPGLNPELAALFLHPVDSNSKKRKQDGPSSPSKRARAEEEVEEARRAESVALSQGPLELDVDARPLDASFDFPEEQPLVDDFQLDVPDVNLELGNNERARSVMTDRSRSRMSSIAPEEADHVPGDAACPVSIFDTALQATQGTQPQDAEVATADKSGYSKNTVKALGLIRQELSPSEDDEGQHEEDRSLSFKTMTHKASRRAASSFFFELLVLSTRDCLKVAQPKPFDDITIHAKPKLWEQQNAHTELEVDAS
ncbi:hypothetical protein CVT24_009713 [Panaeolus cyanescens]|uniref:Rad21/Rec8-like protein N-terminal domain-containing protein n=1 Tax=Panaeolus cyanescens TaxID=181874 RepID=A0A409Y9J1_9AGAR|nr:hypothetical protein CVT24_009713 [Panaeolus cyanescens]